MTHVACLFPGQGSQKVGMGKDFYDRFSLARDAFNRADEVLGFKLSELCFEGPEETLKLTQFTQPALLTISTVAFGLLEAEPVVAAGHSLGEYSALVAAGGLKFEDALRLVHRRGQYMQEAVPVGSGAMAAVIGVPAPTVREAISRVSRGVVEIANWNSIDQIVIAGHKEAVEQALSLVSGARSVMLPVSAPFHTSLMKSAEEKLSRDLDAAEFGELRFPVITNVDAKIIRSGAEARDALKRQVSRPVLWYETMMLLARQGVTAAVEVGSGKVLTGLMKRISREMEKPLTLLQVEDGESLVKCRQALAGLT